MAGDPVREPLKVEVPGNKPWMIYQAQAPAPMPTRPSGPWERFRDPTGLPPKVEGQGNVLDTAAEAMMNVGPSALQFAKDTVQPFLHPVDTAKAIGSLATDPNSRKAFVDFYVERYGGIDNLKRTIATDPVGFLGDLSTALTFGGAALARGPAQVGAVGRAAQTAGKWTDPGYLAARGAQETGRTVFPAAAGTITGTGRAPFDQAIDAGYRGNQQQRDVFTDNMRGNVPRAEAVHRAQQTVRDIRSDRNSAYEQQMGLLRQDTRQLDIQPVLDEWQTLQASMRTRAGVETVNETTMNKLREVSDAIVKTINAGDTSIEALDGLKKRIGEIYPDNPKQNQLQRAVGRMQDVLRDTISHQAPQYRQILEQYATDSRLLDELEGTLSLGTDASVDQALRKLQSIMRDGADANYGQRTVLGNELDARGANVLPAMAGQSLNTWGPRGLARLGPVFGGSAGGAGGLLAGLATAVATGAAQAPRVWGEATYAGARTARGIRDLANAVGLTPGGARAMELGGFQAGRAANEIDHRRMLAAALSAQPAPNSPTPR